MHLREGERILKIYRHHPTPFVLDIFKVMIGTFPFYLMLFLFQNVLSSAWYIIGHLIILGLFSLILVYLSLIYWLDKLVLTNFRVIHIDWKYLTVRNEAEAELDDIQDIHTEEKGVLAFLWVLDYGVLILDTASAHVTLRFEDAPDPEQIRRFIYHLRNQ